MVTPVVATEAELSVRPTDVPSDARGPSNTTPFVEKATWGVLVNSNRIPSLTAVALGTCLTACGACTGAESEKDDAGGPFDAEADRPVDALVKDVLDASDAEAAVQDARPDGCAPYPPSASVPPGWEPWTGWSCDCPLYHPGPGAEGPEPIEWEPCTAPIPSHLTCKRKKHAWNEEGPAIGLFPKWAKTASGSILSFSRVNFLGDRNARYILVADVDGPVHVGLLQINPENKGCVVNPEAFERDSVSVHRIGRYVGWHAPGTGRHRRLSRRSDR